MWIEIKGEISLNWPTTSITTKQPPYIQTAIRKPRIIARPRYYFKRKNDIKPNSRQANARVERNGRMNKNK